MTIARLQRLLWAYLVLELVSLVVLLSSCSAFTEPAGAEPTAPPAVSAWAASYLDNCAGVGSDPTQWQRIAWYRVPGAADFDCGGVQAVGCWYGPHDIYLLDAYRENQRTVAHELLHDRLRDPSHTSPAWRACGLV